LTDIPRSQRQNLPASGSQLPGPSFARTQFAGAGKRADAVTSRGIATVSDTIQKISIVAMRANDDAEYEKEVIRVGAEWDDAQLRLKKENLSAGAYQIKAKKERDKIISGASAGFRNKKKLDLALERFKNGSEKQITKEYIGKTSDNSLAVLGSVKTTLIENVISGNLAVQEAKDSYASKVQDRVNNLMLSEEQAGNKIRAFNDIVSFEAFKRDLVNNPVGVGAKSIDELQKDYGLSGKDATRAKIAASTGSSIKKQTFKANISDHMSSIVTTGKGFLDIDEAVKILEPEELGAFSRSQNFAYDVHDAFENIEFLNPEQMDNMLDFFEPEAGEGFREKQTVFESLQRAVLAEKEDRKKNRYENSARSVDSEGKTHEEFVDAVVAMERKKGALEREIEVTGEKVRSKFKGEWVAGNVSEKKELRSSLSSLYGKWENNALEELMDSNMDNTFNMIDILTDNIVINNFLDAQQGVAETKELLTTRKEDVSGIKSHVDNYFQKGFGGTISNLSPEDSDSYRIPVENYALLLARQGVPDPARQAVKEIFDNNFDYQNGLRYPKGKYNLHKQGAFIGEILEGKHIDLARVIKDKTGVSFGKRPDGTKKGKGFFGVLKVGGNLSNTDAVATEFSVQSNAVKVDGKQIDFPAFSESQPKKNIDRLLNDIIPNNKPIPEDIMRIAIDDANKRLSKGMSVFFDPSKDIAGPQLPSPPEFIEEFFAADFQANAKFITNEVGDGFYVFKDQTELQESQEGQEIRRIEFKYDDIEFADTPTSGSMMSVGFEFMLD